MKRIPRHIAPLLRTLLAVLLLVASIPYRSSACAHRGGEGVREKASCCRHASMPEKPRHGKGCCKPDFAQCCCSIVPVARFFINSSGDSDILPRALPETWFVSPLYTRPSVPPIPPPRA
jgi:hypothetical protein